MSAIEGISNQLAILNIPWLEYHIPILYRKVTTDENVIREVIEKECYRRVRIGFEVRKGERWLDLGANIGAFAVYCYTKGAIAECYEPEPDCFGLLQKNVPWRGFSCHSAAVTHLTANSIQLWRSPTEGNHSRSTVCHPKGSRFCNPVEVANVCAGCLGGIYDGVKMDIEGAEFGIIDERLIPHCDKLVLEYHTSRDKSVANLGRRLDILRSLYRQVVYPDNLGKLLTQGEGDARTYYDRLIYCIGRR